jgi:chaperonin GroEL
MKGTNAEQQAGISIVKRAIEEPLRQISFNAGLEGSIVVDKVINNTSPAFGFNALTETYEDLIAAGVIDPAKVSRCALQNAASVASLMLTTETLIAEKPKKDMPSMPGGPGGMDGMM